MKRAVILAILTLALAAPAAQAALLTAAADTYVRAGTSTNTNYNAGATLPYLDVKSQSGDMQWTRKTYVRFDLSSYTDPITDASLDLVIAGALGASTSTKVWTFAVYGLRDDFAPGAGILGNDWGETAITWNNAPGNDLASSTGIDVAAMYGAAPLGTFTITGKGTTGSGVGISGGPGSALVDFLKSDTDGRVTFVVVRPTDGTTTESVVHQFASRENSSYAGPQLNLVPEPATLALLGAGLAFVAARRMK
jgi:hypothetical protein